MLDQPPVVISWYTVISDWLRVSENKEGWLNKAGLDSVIYYLALCMCVSVCLCFVFALKP